MEASDDSSMSFMDPGADGPDGGLRYMRRRRVSRVDRNGDPLDGIVNLWDVAIVLAVGFLVMALTGLGISGVLTSDNMTIVTNPGTDEMQVIVKEGDELKSLDLSTAPQVSGVGTLLGSFYELADGTVVYVPSGELAPEGATPTTPEVTPTPGVTSTPTAYPSVTATPGATQTPDITVTPTPRGGL